MNRLKRRSVIRAALFYPAFAWMLLSVSDLLVGVGQDRPCLEYATYLLVLGYPITLLFAARKRLVKHHRFKNQTRKISRSLIPPQIRIRKVYRAWQRRDVPNWPIVHSNCHSGINRYEYSLLSQHGEDGIIRYVFDQIGFDQRFFLEFGFGAHQCNSLRLMLKENFGGLLIDASQETCDFFNRSATHFSIPDVRAICRSLDCQNLDETIRLAALPGEIDFLSIDVDGNDYWLWKELKYVSARLAVIEYNAGLGSTWSATIPYDPEYRLGESFPDSFFYGASLPALEKLGREKGYRLIGCDSRGVNSFFLREDIPAPEIRTLTPEAAYQPHRNWLDRGIPATQQLEIMKGLPYQDV